MLKCETREDALARLGRALADPTRCRILVALLDGTPYPAQLADQLGLSRSNVSNHLSCLRGCGLVVAAYEGRQVRYTPADAHLARALRELVKVVLTVDTDEECLDAPVAARATDEKCLGAPVAARPTGQERVDAPVAARP
ncbi:Cd(II)/Pb(II)-sensing metalloregulatory transcriptional regulator CmtR [Actinosynnema sp. CS-041913]|uniref:Cd(II)/Pb(II)-sensing metalloregulatory transcriptional regulator CmtR n=1 Tax=Actinosynnema sp. CS-041913 TaxID=3239917 RepID=UPI003D913CE0